MGVKVVQGFVGSERPDVRGAQGSTAPSTPVNPPATVSPQTQSAQAQSHTIRQASSDAVVTTLRSASRTSSNEKVRDFKEAKDLSNTVAERIREGGRGSSDAHASLDSTQAREHFTE